MGDGMPVIEHTFWLCPEHAEDNAVECTCGLVPYVPKAQVERLRRLLVAEMILTRTGAEMREEFPGYEQYLGYA